jgi:SAM-dependent methyltransferase
MPKDNRQGLSRAYSEETWRVYEQLESTFDPRGPDTLYSFAMPYLGKDSLVLDAGCRNAKHLIELVQRSGGAGVGVEPVHVHFGWAREAVDAAGLGDRIDLHEGLLESLPRPDAAFDFIWCRDVVEQVADLRGFMTTARRLLKPEGRMLVYTVFYSDLMCAQERAMMERTLANVPANLIEKDVETEFTRAKFAVEEKTAVQSEWAEHVEEHERRASNTLLQLSRLRRHRSELAERFGHDVIDHVEAILHWQPFLLLGKLVPRVYVLKPTR